MLLTNFRAEYRDRLLSVLWRQWTALGVAGSKNAWNASVVDPEALLLITCTLARSDPRLFDAVLEWLRINGQYINVQRIKRMLRDEVFVGEPVLNAVAAKISTSVSQNKWAKLADGPSTGPTVRSRYFFCPTVIHSRLSGRKMRGSQSLASRVSSSSSVEWPKYFARNTPAIFSFD